MSGNTKPGEEHEKKARIEPLGQIQPLDIDMGLSCSNTVLII